MCLLSAQMPNYVEDSFLDFNKGLVSLVFGKKCYACEAFGGVVLEGNESLVYGSRKHGNYYLFL